MYKIHETCQIDHKKLQDVYMSVFGYKENGSFVEIGAFDGITYGFTWGLSTIGWKALYVEASPANANSCKQNYASLPNVTIETCAIGDHDGKATLYVGGAVSSVLLNKVNIDWGLRAEYNVEVPMMTMDSLLAKHNWDKKYDLLVIDVEEAEMLVLNGYNINLHRPKLAIVENVESRHPDINNWFLDKDYSILHADSVNTIFVDKK